MRKLFKLRIFQSCRSKDPSTLPAAPVPSFLRFSPVNHQIVAVDVPVTPPLSRPQPRRRSSFKRHVSSAFTSVGCGGIGTKSTAPSGSEDERTRSSEFKWQREGKWHVIAKVHEEIPRRKIYNSSVSGDDGDGEDGSAAPPPPTPAEKKKKLRRSNKKKKIVPARFRLSTSSADSGLFSSEAGGDDVSAGEETETLVSSSRSFSTDSSTELNPHLEPIHEALTTRTRRKKKPIRRNQRRRVHKGASRSSVSSSESETPARLSLFKKLIPCVVEGKVKESFAVVKKSEDPYEDFKRSMAEMILEKQMFEERELEELLQCFLSLNSVLHHGVIVEAFTEIWEAMFGGSTCQRDSLSLSN